MKHLTHNEAVLLCLLEHPNQWVPLPVIRKFTAGMCRTECYPVNSRSSDLKHLFGYRTENDTRQKEGITHSFYKIHISEAEKAAFSRLYERGKIPHFNQVRAVMKPVQKTLFEVEYD